MKVDAAEAKTFARFFAVEKVVRTLLSSSIVA